MKRRFTWVLAFALSLGMAVAAPAVAATSGPTGHSQIPSAVPSAITPAVNDGYVDAIVQVGTTMVIGGTFTNLTPTGGVATAEPGSPASTRRPERCERSTRCSTARSTT